jgi:pilus assembly protein CpaC
MIVSSSHPFRRPASLRKVAAAVGIAVLAGCVLGAPKVDAAQTAAYLRVSASARGSTQSVSLDINKSMIIDLPANVGEVIASQPTVANVIMRTKTRAIVQGLAAGGTNIIFLDANGAQVSVLDVTVGGQADIGPALQTVISRTIPGSGIRVESVKNDDGNSTSNHVVLTGTADSQDDAARATAIAAQFSGGDANVTNLIEVAGSQQVKLKVTVAEVNREVVKQLGINLDGSLSVSPLTLGLNNVPTLGGASGVVTGNGFSASGTIGDLTINAAMRALEQRGAIRSLAEPTLTAMSGQEASFMAGGQFPVPTDVDDDGHVAYTYKDFGVNLKFTPTIKSNGIIGLKVDTDVSELTTEGSLSVGTITIPALRKRTASTTIELPQGQTLGIAGMFQDSIRQQINSLPGLGNIPILGALFRSRDYIHSQTELVVLVTPYLASPGPRPETPVDQMHFAGDAEAVFLGHMEAMYGVDHSTGMRGSYQGNVGFVLD